jgi:hypothetical protein
MTQFRLPLILCLILKAQSSYCQSVDSLPLKELNNEFLKGIKARERVVLLKKVIHNDSIQLSIYKDSIVPGMQKSIDTSRKELVKLYSKLESREKVIKGYRYTSIGLLCLVLGLLL